ncbi:hypothetical protein INT45_006968 [Circinella minor]|uniref:Galactose oxidase n=1 Tax=Circinella minor TaxID=1195481 RepID=A0A8H7S3X9_9FUNG|nr:hypothetical protein INT45_006968 [Circinella minor]
MTRLWRRTLFFISTLLPTTLFAQDQCNFGPQGRTGFTPILLNDHVYLVGGSVTELDIFSLDLTQGLQADCPQWSRPSNISTNEQYMPFTYGASFPGTDGKTIFIQSGDRGTNEMDRMVQYDATTGWHTSMTSGRTPTPRAAMTASINSTGFALYYGGRSPVGTTGNQSYPHSHGHLLHTAGENHHHVSVIQALSCNQDKLFVFGGTIYVDQSTRLYADFRSVLVFDTAENKAVSMATIGDIPPPRLLFSATAAPDGKSIVVYGGLNTSSPDTFDSSSDVFVLDTCNLEWSKPDVGGDAPAPRADHGAVTYGNYMVLIYGYTDVTPIFNSKVPTYTNQIDILDMNSWKWVRSMSHQDNPTAKDDPGCSYNFPRFPDDTNLTEGDNPMPYDPTVVSNPNKPTNTGRNKGLAIGFALLGLFLVCGVFFWYFRRQRRKARAMNPRWLPGAITSHKGGANNDYPLFVYNNLDDKNNINENGKQDEKKSAQLSDGFDGTRTYTANDHDQWERALDQDPERPEDGRAMSRHMDVWERMRNLHDQRNP